jgi:tRNA A37 threonylcarbamoyladenosine biosynthesis protein TsaE
MAFLIVRSDLGSGKTTFVKNYIQTVVDDSSLIVSSPSYLLKNTYELIDDTRSIRGPIISPIF